MNLERHKLAELVDHAQRGQAQRVEAALELLRRKELRLLKREATRKRAGEA